jgi:hypothetical protein
MRAKQLAKQTGERPLLFMIEPGEQHLLVFEMCGRDSVDERQAFARELDEHAPTVTRVLAADSSGAQRADVVADLLQRRRERRELARVQVLQEVLLDAAMVHGPRISERLVSCWRDQDLDHAPILWWSLTKDEAVGFHAVDHPGEAALTGQDAIGELGHAQPVGCVLEMNERVVPDQRDAAFGLQLGIEDVDQGERAFNENAPVRECSRGGS